jgi:hypothetical protein
MNYDNTDNYPMWVIYGISASTSETGRWYVSAKTAETALVTFWEINARDHNSTRYEWIVETFVEASDTNPA